MMSLTTICMIFDGLSEVNSFGEHQINPQHWRGDEKREAAAFFEVWFNWWCRLIWYRQKHAKQLIKYVKYVNGLAMYW